MLPLMLTLVNLQSVYIETGDLGRFYVITRILLQSALNPLHAALQFSSVRDLQFLDDDDPPRWDLHAEFLRMFCQLRYTG